MKKADYGAVPITEAKAELVEATTDDLYLVDGSQATTKQRCKTFAFIVLGLFILSGIWKSFSHHPSGSKSHPLVIPPPPPGPNDGPSPKILPKRPKSMKDSKKKDSKKKDPKSKKSKSKKKDTKSKKTKSKKR